MDDDCICCEICMEKYDLANRDRQPKKLECCGKVFCYHCLMDLFNKYGNKIICPICRKNTTKNPSELMTDNSVFDALLTCTNCGERITKSEVYVAFGEAGQLRCKNCQNEDMPLAEYVPILKDEISNFLDANRIKRGEDIYEKLNQKIMDLLNPYFEDWKHQVYERLRIIIYKEIKQNMGYDLEEDFNKFKNNIDRMYKALDDLRAFVNDDAKLTLEQISNDLSFYSQNFDTLRTNVASSQRLKEFITQNTFFCLKNGIDQSQVGEFIYGLFETFFSAYTKNSYLTGIDYYDSYYLELKAKIENAEISKEDMQIKINELEKENDLMKKELNEIQERKINNMNLDNNLGDVFNKNNPFNPENKNEVNEDQEREGMSIAERIKMFEQNEEMKRKKSDQNPNLEKKNSFNIFDKEMDNMNNEDNQKKNENFFNIQMNIEDFGSGNLFGRKDG